jgi:hypothetical protein
MMFQGQASILGAKELWKKRVPKEQGSFLRLVGVARKAMDL